MTEEPRRVGRIVIAVDAADVGDLALELARHVTESMSPELLGLFVENARLLDCSRSRLAREITRSGRERPIVRDRLERQIRYESAEARSRFERAAARLGMRSSFRVARGEIVAELLQQAAEAEALVVSLAEAGALPDPWLGAAVERLVRDGVPVLLFARAGWSRGRSIAVVVDTAARHAAVHAAARLANASGSPLAVLLTGSALDDRAAAVQRVLEAAAGHGAEVGDVIAVGAATAPSLARAARFCGARLLVLTSGDPPVEARLVLELLRRLPSALMLVRG